MRESGDTRKRGTTSSAVIGVLWVGLGFWYVEGGEMGPAAGFVILGLLMGSTYVWPDSALDRFLSAPLWRRKRPAGR